MDTVIVSPALARDVYPALSELIVTAVSVGAVRSIVTALPSVTLVTVTPGLLAKSLKAIDRLAVPSVTSAATTTYDAVYVRASVAVTAALLPAMATLGVVMASFATNDTVIVSPTFATDVKAVLFDSMRTVVSVGAVRST
jgi:hypothetical protein